METALTALLWVFVIAFGLAALLGVLVLALAVVAAYRAQRDSEINVTQNFPIPPDLSDWRVQHTPRDGGDAA